MQVKILFILIILIGLGIAGFSIFQNSFQPEEMIKTEEEPVEEIETETGAETIPQEKLEEEEMGEEEEISEEETGGAETEIPLEELAEELAEKITEIPETPSVPELISWRKETGVRVPGAVSSCTISKGNQYWMYYTAIGGIHLARSTDGLNFQEYGTVLSNGPWGSEQEMVSNSSVFQLGNGGYRMIYEGSQDYQAVRKLYSAVSSDGLTWIKESGVRLEDSISFYDAKKGKTVEMTFTSVPDVIELGNGCLRMYYTAVDESRIAESCDDGLIWQKKGKIMFDVYPEVVQDPDIIQLANSQYKLFFSTQNSERTSQWILSAVSEDGINFKIDSGTRIEPTSGKARAVDPDVFKLSDGTYRMYYGESFSFDGDFDIFSVISKD